MSSRSVLRSALMIGTSLCVVACAKNATEPAAATAEAIPAQQWAIVQAGTGGAEALTYKQIPVLEPGEGQVLVKVYAVAVNPIDWKSRSGIVGVQRPAGAPMGEGEPTVTAPTPENTRVPGSDAAGVVAKVGVGVTQFKVGDAVFALVGRGGPSSAAGQLNGAYSEYVLADAANVVAKPATMTYAQASGLGTASVTGARAVMQVNVQNGQRVLISGAAGGVGSAATQVAKARGAHVIAIASGRHEDYLKQQLGVDEFYDYTKVDWANQLKDVDVVIDTVSAEDATKALKVLKKGGKLASVVGRPDADACQAAGVDCGNQGPGGGAGMGAGGPPSGPDAGGMGDGMASGPPSGGAPDAGGMAADGMNAGGMGGGQSGNTEALAEVVKLANDGKFIVNVDATFPLEKAYDAQEENRNGGTQGKIVLIVNPAANDK